jgi:hypothetical protein
MNAMRTVMLGADRQNVFLVERVDDEQHAAIIPLPRAARERGDGHRVKPLPNKGRPEMFKSYIVSTA